jgi:hypothetical protein
MRRRPNPQSESNIRRIDTKAKARKQTHGFQVHFLRGSTAVTKMFSDSVYGGKEAARRAARKFKKSAIAQAGREAARGGGKKTSSRKKTTSRRAAPSRGSRGRTKKRARR